MTVLQIILILVDWDSPPPPPFDGPEKVDEGDSEVVIWDED
jgi:hypothetical protein